MQYSKYFLMLLMCFQIVGFAQTEKVEMAPKQQNAYSSTLHIGLDGGATWAITDYDRVKPNIIGRGYIDYYFPTSSSGIFGIRGFFQNGYIGGQYGPSGTEPIFRTQISSVGGGLIYALAVKDVIIPYVFVGASYTWFDPQDNNDTPLPGNAANAYDTDEIDFHSNLGMKFLLSKALALNFDVGFQMSPEDYWDDVQSGNVNDLMLTTTVGLSYALFTKNDADHDGVDDDIDRCPNTPPGVKVDPFGCALDTTARIQKSA